MTRATNIQWETDGETVELPNAVDIPADIKPENVADYLSDKYGWLVVSFQIEGEPPEDHRDAALDNQGYSF